MPSGRVHAASTAILSVPACFATLGYSGNWTDALACGLGCLAGIPLTPDLDQESISTSEYWLIKWTLGLGFLWTMFWYPYARLCKHRSVLSHFPVLGTTGRVLYLSILPSIALYFGWQPPRVEPTPLLLGLGGLIASDTLHWFMDVQYGDSPRRRGTRRARH